jgi:Bax protein
VENRRIRLRRLDFGSIGLLGFGVVGLYAAVLGAPLWSATANAAEQPVLEYQALLARGPAMIQVADAAGLSQIFSDLDYHLSGVRTVGVVPRIAVENLPRDLGKILPVEQRKSLFILALLPLVLHANEAIMVDRTRLLSLAPIPLKTWSGPDQMWLGKMAVAYKSQDLEGAELIDELIRRIDIVPTSLSVAQAAEESGWGTSRFAIEGNAIFGQWTTSEAHGLRPSGADKDFKYFVRAFDGPEKSVAAYMRNLNTHDAYVSFRNRRKVQRDQTGKLDSFGLANTMLSYSERGKKYVASIRTIMETNMLTEYDQARLRLGAVDPAINL